MISGFLASPLVGLVTVFFGLVMIVISIAKSLIFKQKVISSYQDEEKEDFSFAEFGIDIIIGGLIASLLIYFLS